MRSMLLQGTLLGTRVNSYQQSPAKAEPRPSKSDIQTEKMVSFIPYWPEVITYRDLANLTGLTKRTILMRVSVAGNRHLIFNDEGRLSRLKRDLSNCEL